LFAKPVRNQPAKATVNVPVQASERSSCGQTVQTEESTEAMLFHLHFGLQTEGPQLLTVACAEGSLLPNLVTSPFGKFTGHLGAR